MNCHLLIPILAALAVIACTAEDKVLTPERTGSPSASPVPTSSPTPAPDSPPGMADTDYWFRGVVTEMNTSCYFDAICSVTVEVTESLGGSVLEDGAEVIVIESYGFSPRRCAGQWRDTPPGREVEVLAHAADGDSLAVCGGEHYFVR